MDSLGIGIIPRNEIPQRERKVEPVTESNPTKTSTEKDKEQYYSEKEYLGKRLDVRG